MVLLLIDSFLKYPRYWEPTVLPLQKNWLQVVWALVDEGVGWWCSSCVQCYPCLILWSVLLEQRIPSVIELKVWKKHRKGFLTKLSRQYYFGILWYRHPIIWNVGIGAVVGPQIHDDTTTIWCGTEKPLVFSIRPTISPNWGQESLGKWHLDPPKVWSSGHAAPVLHGQVESCLW